jgi:hypothetical protein
METMPKASREELLAVIREKLENTVLEVMDAVNEAPEGYLISGSEEKVRDLFSRLRCETYEAALQLRVNAAEAAFSPSEECRDRQKLSQ